MIPPARSPVDDALDTLDAALLRWAQSEWHEDYPAAVAALATVRQELQRLREERDASMRSYDSSLRTLAKAVAAAEAAETDVRQLREERDAWKQKHIDSERDWRKEWLAREAAEAEVRRLTEGLRKISKRTVNLESFRQLEGEDVQTFAAGMSEAYDDCRAIARALLAASPSDGGGA